MIYVVKVADKELLSVSFKMSPEYRRINWPWSTWAILTVTSKNVIALVPQIGDWQLVLAFPLLLYRWINSDKFDFSLSVSEEEAQDVLLPPEITQLEDWEIPLTTQLSNLELEAVSNDSQVYLIIIYFLVNSIPGQ